MHNAIEQHGDMQGFTLVEILITLLISSVVMGAVFSIHQSQQQVYTVQQEVVAMQQNARAGMDILSQDMRMAGYNPRGLTGIGFVNAPVVTGSVTTAFTSDLDGDGTIDVVAQDVNGDGNTDMSEMEQVAYQLLNTGELQRYSTTTVGTLWQTVAENIQAIEFFYTFTDGTQSTAPTVANLSNIRAVTITLLARSANTDLQFVGPAAYNTPSGAVWPLTAGIRYQLLTLTTECRNLGL